MAPENETSGLFRKRPPSKKDKNNVGIWSLVPFGILV